MKQNYNNLWNMYPNNQNNRITPSNTNIINMLNQKSNNNSTSQTLDTSPTIWLFYELIGKEHTFRSSENIPNFQKKVAKLVIKENFDVKNYDLIKIFKEIKKFDEIGIHKYQVLNDKNNIIGFLYYCEKKFFNGKIFLKGINNNFNILYETYKEEIYALKDFYYNYNFFLMLFSENVRPFSKNTNVRLLDNLKDNLILENLTTDDIMDINGEPIIISLEKLIIKDEESKDIKQILQFFNNNGNLETKDYTPDEEKSKIESLKKRNIVNIVIDIEEEN